MQDNKSNQKNGLHQMFLHNSKSGTTSEFKFNTNQNPNQISYSFLQLNNNDHTNLKKSLQLPTSGLENKISPHQFKKLTLDLKPNTIINPQIIINPDKNKVIVAYSPYKQFKQFKSKSQQLKQIKSQNQHQMKKNKKNNGIMEMLRQSVQAYLILNKITYNKDNYESSLIQKLTNPNINRSPLKFPTIQKKIYKNSQMNMFPMNLEIPTYQLNQSKLFPKRKKTMKKVALDIKKSTERYQTSESKNTLIVDGINETQKIQQYRLKKKQIFKQKFDSLKQSQQFHNQQEFAHKYHTLNKIQNSKQIKINTNKSQIKKQKKLTNFLTKQRQFTVYEHKIMTYRDFIFKINFAHNRYDPLILKDQFGLFKSEQKRFKVYIGKGNNSQLIKSLIKRRFWWNIQDEASSSNFVWTQLKMNKYFELQISNNHKQLIYKNQQEQKDQQKMKNKKKKKQKQQINIKKNKYKPILPIGISKIFRQNDIQIYKKFESMISNQQKMQDYDNRLKLIDKKLIPVQDKFKYKIHNHLENNFYLGNKKAMFYNLRQYYGLIKKNVFQYLPLTFHVKKGIQDKQFKQFMKYYKNKQQEISKINKSNQNTQQKKRRNIWIVKPGENTNRGNGIVVIDKIIQLTNKIKKKQTHHNGNPKTYIIQQYIQKPMLYNKRKFDIRHYMLITTLYGKMRGYWYSQGYIRTSSYKFDIDDIGNEMIHLTNDAIQKHGQDYGKYEQGNKISYAQFQKYLDATYPTKNFSFYQTIYPKMRQVALDSIRASYIRLDPKKLQHNFQIFGLDFMIDQNFNVWLIQINTNPCLQISSGLLGRIIPTMVQHSFRLSIDVIFPPMAQYPNTMKHLAPDNALQTLKYELIFDEQNQQKQLLKIYKNNLDLDCGEISEQEEIYQDEGKQCQLQFL